MGKLLGLGVFTALAIASSSVMASVSNLIDAAKQAEVAFEKERRRSENKCSISSQISLKDLDILSKVSRSYLLQPHSGISPKVYGMNFVKRGTHKRTNI